MKFWVLVDGRPVECSFSTLQDRLAMGDEWRRVGRTLLMDQGTTISTVFVPIGQRPLWETMIFGGPADAYQRRYGSADDARRGHDDVVSWVKAGMPKGLPPGSALAKPKRLIAVTDL
jgi:hypothetical protein